MEKVILKKIKKIVSNCTTPFCLNCYIQVPCGTCPNCHSDDLAYQMDEVGAD